MFNVFGFFGPRWRPPWPLWASPGGLLEPLGVSWGDLGAFWSSLGRLWMVSERLVYVLGSWAAFCCLGVVVRLEAEKDAGEHSQGQGILGRRWWRLDMFKMHCQPLVLSVFANGPSKVIGFEWFRRQVEANSSPLLRSGGAGTSGEIASSRPGDACSSCSLSSPWSPSCCSWSCAADGVSPGVAGGIQSCACGRPVRSTLGMPKRSSSPRCRLRRSWCASFGSALNAQGVSTSVRFRVAWCLGAAYSMA